jgi:hypothetical protein
VHHPHHAVVEDRLPLIVSEILEPALTAQADRVDERVELAVPAIAQFVEHALDSFGLGGVGDQSERIGTPAIGQVVRRPLEDILRPADEGHRAPFVGQAAGGPRIPSRDHRRRQLRWRPSARDPWPRRP